MMMMMMMMMMMVMAMMIHAGKETGQTMYICLFVCFKERKKECRQKRV